MAKIGTINDLSNLTTNENLAVTTINDNFDTVETAFQNTLSRDGSSPNSMNANLDMNSFRILNLPSPASDTEPARKYDLNNLTAVAAASFVATSSTSNTIGTGVKTFTIESGKYFAPGQFIVIASGADVTNYMAGQVIGLSGTTLTFNAITTNGSGTHSDWNISMSGTSSASSVIGPGTSTNNDIVLFNGTTGSVIKDSGVGLPTGTLVGTSDTQTLTNKTISGSSNTISNVPATALGIMTGDSGSGGAKGAVPAPAAGDTAANKFLKANGTWSTVLSGRYQLTGNVTVNISTTGNDSLDWINNQSSAFATRNAAYSYFAQHIDLAGHIVTFQCADGTYNDTMQAYGPLVGQLGASSVVFKGNSTSPNNVVITPSIAGYCFGAFYGAMYTIDGFTCSMNPLYCQDSISVGDFAFVIYQNVVFGYNRYPYNHISCSVNATLVNNGSNYITATSVTSNLTTTNGSTSATVASASNLYNYLGIECSSIAAGTYISNISGTTVTLSRPATATGTNSANFWSGAQCHILLGQTATYYDWASGSTDGQIIGVTGKPMFVNGFVNNNGGQMIFQYVGIASGYYIKTANITASSNTFTVSDATGLTTGMHVYSSAIQWGSTISSIVGTTITITGGVATTTVTGVKLGFGTPATTYGTPLVNTGAGYVNFATDVITANGKVDPKYLPGDYATTTNTSFTAGYPSITVTSGEAAAITALFTYYPSGKGLMVFGPGIPVGAVIPDASYISGTSIFLSHPTYSTQSNVSLTIGGFQWNGAQYIVYNDKPTTFGALPPSPTIVNANIQAGTFQTADTNVELWYTSDNTKRIKFDASGVTAGQTRTLTAPDANTTLVGTGTTQTLTNKTLTSPVISTISNTGTLTLPTSTDTLVGRATTDTLTNKTLTNPTITGTTTNDNAGAGVRGEYRLAGAGKQTSATVTMTIASPAVVTWTSHPYQSDGVAKGAVPIVFSTTGALPTGITSGTTYYVVLPAINANTFNLATSIDNAIAGTYINTSGSQSGTHTGTNQTGNLTTGTTADVAGIQLTAGDWDVGMSSGFGGDAATATTATVTSLNTVTTTLNQTPTYFGKFPGFSAPFASAGQMLLTNNGMGRYSISGNTTIYLNVFMNFSGGNAYSVYPTIVARRRR